MSVLNLRLFGNCASKTWAQFWEHVGPLFQKKRLKSEMLPSYHFQSDFDETKSNFTCFFKTNLKTFMKIMYFEVLVKILTILLVKYTEVLLLTSEVLKVPDGTQKSHSIPSNSSCTEETTDLTQILKVTTKFIALKHGY